MWQAEPGAQGNLRDGLVRQGGGLQHRRGLLPLQQPEHRRAVLPALGHVRGEVGLRDPARAPRPSAGGLCAALLPLGRAGARRDPHPSAGHTRLTVPLGFTGGGRT